MAANVINVVQLETSNMLGMAVNVQDALKSETSSTIGTAVNVSVVATNNTIGYTKMEKTIIVKLTETPLPDTLQCWFPYVDVKSVELKKNSR